MFRTLALAVTATLLTGAAQAATLYSEDFTSQNGEGLTGPSPAAIHNAGNGNWSVALNGGAFFNASDYAQVVGGQFEFRDTNTGCATASCNSSAERSQDYAALTLPTWTSSAISTTGFTNLTLTMDLSGDGDFEFGGGVNSEDDMIVSVLLDGVRTELFDFIQGNGSSAAVMMNTVLADAATVQIEVAGNNYAGGEYLRFDNVLLTGDAVAAPVPLPGSVLLLIGGLAGMGVLRRRG